MTEDTLASATSTTSTSLQQIELNAQADEQPEAVQADKIDNEVEAEVKKQTTKVEIMVPKYALKYNLKPSVISESKIVYLNAQDMQFYKRTPKTVVLTVWLLVDPEEPVFNYTAKRLFETAYKNNIELKIIETGKLDLIVSPEGLHHILYEGQKMENLPDAVLPRLGAKITYFSLAVVRQLEKMGVLVLNRNEALEISRDKLYTVQTLGAHNLPIPKTMIAKFPLLPESITREFTYPVILKRSSGSQGKGVMLIQNQEHLNDIADMIDTSKPLIFQEYISNSHGRDIRVIVVGGKAVGAMMRIAKKGFKSNFHQGGYVKPVKLSPEVEWLAIEAAKLIGLDIAGVDILIDQNTYKICEINSTPGFQGFEMATGIDVASAIVDFVRVRTGVWKKPSATSKKVVTIPVAAEHKTIVPTKAQEVSEATETATTTQSGAPQQS